MEACPLSRDGCAYTDTDQCLLTTHHRFWPRRDYTTPLEKAFRQLPDNKERLARCDHDRVHVESPPPLKPDLAAMRAAVNAERLRRYE